MKTHSRAARARAALTVAAFAAYALTPKSRVAVRWTDTSRHDHNGRVSLVFTARIGRP